MIIYNETRARFLDDVDQNQLGFRLSDSFRTMTGSVPSDSRVWTDEYSRFSLVLRNARIEDDVRVALEYHISAAGRFRIDVLLAGNDGERENGVIVELKAWEYEFKVFDRAEDLHAELSRRNRENKARLVAGYSWEWPSEGRQRGTARTHVMADGLALPWNFDGENWATSRDGISQVGCVHTSQGLEFDWLGVLIGEDLVYRDGRVQGNPARRARSDASLKGSKKALKDAGDDPELRKAVLDRIDLIIKSTYKVLLSRGRKGCFVWCADLALREYLKARLTLVINHSPTTSTPSVIVGVPYEGLGASNTPFIEVPEPRLDRYVNALPVVDLKFAAGFFSDEQAFDENAIVWVEPPEHIRPAEELFIAQTIGESMNRRIPNGSWCLFKLNPGGTRQGKVVVARHSSIHDPDLGGQYTVKVYRSEKEIRPDDSWRHTRITLSPDSTEPGFKPLEFDNEDANLSIVAELVAVLG